MAAIKSIDAFAALDKIRTGSYKHGELVKALDYIRDNYPVHYDRIVTALVDARTAMADDILHRSLLEDESDKRQTRLEL